MKYFLLCYAYPADYLEKRAPHRAAHFAYASPFVARGELLLGGAYAEEPHGAALVFRVADRAQVEAFVWSDPYVLQGVVDSWTIREWVVVLGSQLPEAEA